MGNSTYKAAYSLAVRQRRKELGWSQATLGDLGDIEISESTISRIERGIVIPSHRILDLIFSKLGLNPSNLVTSYITRKDAALQRQLDDLDIHLAKGNSAGAEKIITLLESNSKFMSEKINEQYVWAVKVAYNRIIGTADEKILEMIPKAFPLIKGISKKSMETMFFTNIYFNMINIYISILFSRGQRDEAIDLYYALKENTEKHCADKFERGRRLPMLIYNLAECLNLMERFDEPLNLCSEGIELCVDTGFLLLVPNLAKIEAGCRLEMGQEEDAIEVYRRVYYGLKLLRKFSDAEEIKVYVKTYLDVDL